MENLVQGVFVLEHTWQSRAQVNTPGFHTQMLASADKLKLLIAQFYNYALQGLQSFFPDLEQQVLLSIGALHERVVAIEEQAQQSLG